MDAALLTVPAVPAAVPEAPSLALQTERATAVWIDNLTVSYRQHPAVHHLSCRFAVGSLNAIVGPNGAGKSSLLDAMVGKVQPSTGEVRLGVRERSQVAYLPQQSHIDRSFPLRVTDVVMLGAWASLGWFGGATGQHRQRAVRALAEVGLDGFGQRLVGELSVGQFQRVLFARVLMQDAPLILLDEPFNAIDARTTGDLLQLVHRWHAEGRTVLAVLHDIDQVRAHFPQTLLLAREGLAFGPTAQVLTPANLQRARHLAERWDDAAAWCHRDATAPLAAASGAPTVGGEAGHLAASGHDHDHGHGHHIHSHGHGPGQSPAHPHGHTGDRAHGQRPAPADTPLWP